VSRICGLRTRSSVSDEAEGDSAVHRRSDCNMEEGSLRCDANVSVMLKGRRSLGRRLGKERQQLSPLLRCVEYEIDGRLASSDGGRVVSLARTVRRDDLLDAE
jgi:Asp-tRNA(Asn)/Glu-tRNA(Gln) amidotransferase B subunit